MTEKRAQGFEKRKSEQDSSSQHRRGTSRKGSGGWYGKESHFTEKTHNLPNHTRDRAAETVITDWEWSKFLGSRQARKVVEA